MLQPFRPSVWHCEKPTRLHWSRRRDGNGPGWNRPGQKGESMPWIAVGRHAYLNLNRGLGWLASPSWPLKHGISELSACVKITGGLVCALSSMFLHTDSGAPPCLHWGIDRPSCLILPDITRARRAWERAEGPCLLTEPWGRALASGSAAVSGGTGCSLGPLLGWAVIRAALGGVECLRDLKPGRSSWRGCVHEPVCTEYAP